MPKQDHPSQNRAVRISSDPAKLSPDTLARVAETYSGAAKAALKIGDVTEALHNLADAVAFQAFATLAQERRERVKAEARLASWPEARY
jgi:hypothetical protein